MVTAEQIKVGDVILPPEREVRLWMRRYVREHELSDAALHLTVLDVHEGEPDKGGRWVVFRCQQAAEWGGAGLPFVFKARPTTPWRTVEEVTR